MSQRAPQFPFSNEKVARGLVERHRRAVWRQPTGTLPLRISDAAPMPRKSNAL